MTSRDFCYWLQGWFEIDEAGRREDFTKEQLTVIKKHLALVFKHEIDPSMGNALHQQLLNEIHSDMPDHMKPGKPGGDIHIRC